MCVRVCVCVCERKGNVCVAVCVSLYGTLHLLFIGIFFLVVSQVAPFQEQLLSFMLIIGIILVSVAIIGRILKTIGKKIKKELVKEEKPKIPVSKNNYLTYFLIFLAFISTLSGLMTMSSSFEDESTINNFEECIAAGNPAMESYPRQCRTADGKHFVEIIPGKEQCEIAGGLWGIWGNQLSATASCNPSTSDGGKECSDSSQCQSFCQAKEGAQIGIEDTGMCYEYEFAICMQEVRNGVVDAEWCQ